MLLDRHDLAGLPGRTDHSLFIQRFDRMHIDDFCTDSLRRQLLSCCQGFGYRKAGRDDGNIRPFSQRDRLPKLELIVLILIDDRNRQSAEPQIHRPHMLVSRLHRRLRFHIIRRIDHNHPRYRPHQRDILITLMGRAVFSYRDPRMGRADLHIQMRISDRITHLFKCTSRREHSERTRERNLARRGDPRRNSHHIALCDTAVDMAFRECLLEYSRLGRRRQIGV